MSIKEPIIAIVGRPNVGKSTLFNRIVGERRAVVEDEPGVTRDRNYARVERFSIPFYLVDTGGFEDSPEDELGQAVVEQTMCAVQEADFVLCLFDSAHGLHPSDMDIVRALRTRTSNVVFVANKCDGVEQGIRKIEFYELGVSEVCDISALHGRGVNSLIEELLERLPCYNALKQSTDDKQRAANRREEEAKAACEAIDDSQDEELDVYELFESQDIPGKNIPDRLERNCDDTVFAPVFVPEEDDSIDDYIRANRVAESLKREGKDPNDEQNEEEAQEEVQHIECIQFAIVGRPNVGKSTLLNTLTGERRSITSPIAGTTRDVVDVEITRDGQRYILLDTAGLRKKARISDKVERFSVIRALEAIREADVAVVVIDATQGVSEQDVKIVGLAHDLGKGIIIAVNKWDVVEKTHRSVKEATNQVRNALKFAPYAPLVFISALSGRRCPRIIELVKQVAYERTKRISTGAINGLLKKAHQRFNPGVYRGRPIKLLFATQVTSAPPTFVLFFNYAKSLHFSYLRFIKNAIRDHFGFVGTDIRLRIRKRATVIGKKR